MGVVEKMINDWIISFISIFTNFYNDHLHTHMQSLLSLITEWQNHTTLFNDLLSAVFFIVGKPLCIFMLTCFVTVLTIRLIMAIVNIVGQFIP